ncbi:hypothetical protein HF264_18970 [Rhizobium leguminosarum]|nr:hypothetical protein [Rhizobium leguminosarum]MBY2941770.1 hypothetical protein [Rhizobium leguminosarum]
MTKHSVVVYRSRFVTCPEVTTLAFASHYNLSKLSAWWRVGIAIERTKLV